MALFAGGIAMVAQSKLPDVDALLQSSFICTSEVTEAQSCNSQTAMARLSEDQDRVNVRLENVDEDLVEAVVAAEDRNFYEHTGIDPVGIARALYRDVRAGGITQGGSTITQQFVKNTFLTHDQTLRRKLDEALLAIRVEQEMSKDQILEGYLNTIYLGRNAYGVQAATRAYFGASVDASDLTLEQATYLAGLIRAPELADAERNPEEAERRRSTVLDAMLEEGYIDEDEHTWADAVPFEPPYVVPRESFRQSTTMWPEGDGKGMQYVNEFVKGEASGILQSRLGYTQEDATRAIANGGLRIYTTIDRNLQSAAYDAVYTNTLNQEGDPAGALVALNNQGQVVAMVGGPAGTDQSANFAVEGYGSGGRPVGSTFKPIALADAILRNYSLTGSSLPAPGTTTIPSIPGCEAWEVSNFDEEDAPSGAFNLVEATQYSSNTAYGHLMAELGPDSVKSMAERLGMNSELSDCLPTVLGADNSNPLEMAEVYSTFANRGMHREPSIITRIEQVNEDGEVEQLYEWSAEENQSQVMAPEQADLVNYTLQQVVESGTGENANFGKPAAGKTGTTSSNRDAWFVGYTPNITASVWMGFPNADTPEVDPETGEPILDENGQPRLVTPPMNSQGRVVHGLESVTGGSLPAEIWRKFMEVATGEVADPFTEPTPEALREGTRVGGGGGYDSGEGADPSVTTVPGPGGGGTQPTDPTQTTGTQPGQTTATTETTSTSTPDTTDTTFPDTIFPPSTGPPGGGGGDNG
jgi:membrane peptidoglycan carboxypeptidase